MAGRTHRCTEATRSGRLEKATQFADAADILETTPDDHQS